jgi:23S rRNA pseudouridine1911/1915/1917 synthase
MAKPKQIDLGEGSLIIPILYEDRSVMALDKPAGWLLVPDSWDQTGRNLQLALNSSINAGDFWSHSRNLKYLRYIHRLDAETTGVILFAKSPGALRAYSELFEDRQVEKTYLAVVRGVPRQKEWTCRSALEQDPAMRGRMRSVPADHQAGRGEPGPDGPRDAETRFRLVRATAATALVEASPTTGRTHQIRVHLADAGHPVLGDVLYGPEQGVGNRVRPRLALRAVQLLFRDPFQKRTIRVEAPVTEFLREFGLEPPGNAALRGDFSPPNLSG